MKLGNLLYNVEKVVGQDELENSISNGEKLKIKFGVDPTRPDLTFGHLVVFNKLKQFQEAGHETILLIGDYTAQIGDPSGRSDLRPELTEDEVNENAKTYLDQAFKIIDKDKTVVRRNSEWFSEMKFGDSLSLARKMTVARMLERDDFEKRYKNSQPISIVEFIYPLVQGYDSIMLESDVEIGGSDQLFNMLVGRTLQKDAGQKQQAVITMPLLVGLDGNKKMSKSYDNYISFNDSSKDIFGKVMSISDEVMWDYFRLLLLKDDQIINELRSKHPMEAKKQLAEELTALFFGFNVAKNESENFSNVFTKGENPDDMQVISLSEYFSDGEKATLLSILFHSNNFESKGEIRRLFKQGAVKLDGKKCDQADYEITSENADRIVRVGKKVFVKIIN